jgi:hypothetical protein
MANGAPLTFEQIVKRGRGRSLLGYLKMDVDRLGELFAFGLGRNGGGLDTLPRLAALSRLLDAFFSRRLPILIREGFPNCYQVYAGGDDVLVIGPWWETLGLAQAVRAAFRAWVAENSEITISAGLAVTQLRTPVATAAQMADAALEAAKHGTPEPGSALVEARRRRGLSPEAWEQPARAAPCVPEDPTGARGRDCASLLGDVLSWDHLALVVADAERLAPERPPSALLHRLLAFAGMWQEFRDGDPAGLRLFPFLAYALRRTIDPRRQPLLAAWAQHLGSAGHRDGERDTPVEHLGLVARLLLLLARETDDE